MRTIKFFMLLLATALVVASCDNDNNDESIAKTEAKITEFAVGTTKANIDESDKIVYLTLPSGSDLTKVKFTVSLSENAKIDLTTEDFSNDITCTVTAEDGSTQTYTIIIMTEGEGTTPSEELTDYDVQITGVDDTAYYPGDEITITGKNFRSKNNFVTFVENGVALKIVSESTTEIKAIIPKSVYGGEYSLQVRCGSDKKTHVYENKIRVASDLDPFITSVKSDKLISGTDDLVINGVNLKGDKMYLNIARGGWAVSQQINVIANDAGTIATCTAADLANFEAGTYYISLTVDSKITNRLQFTLLKSNDSAPRIVKAWDLTFYVGSYIMMDAINFDEKDVTIKVIDKKDVATTVPILSKNIKENEIIVGADLPVGEYKAFEITSNGKSSRYEATIIAKDGGQPVGESLSETEAIPGTIVHITCKNIYAHDEVTVKVGGATAKGHVHHNNLIMFKVPENAAKGVTNVEVYRDFSLGLDNGEKLYFTMPSKLTIK